jgi:hypothetical protein
MHSARICKVGMVRLNVQRVDDTRNVTQDRKQDVDEEIGIATSLKEDTERREDDGKNDLADVAVKRSVSTAGARRGRGRKAQSITYDAVNGMLTVLWWSGIIN